MVYVITHNDVEGTHNWLYAPNEVGYLRHMHRHLFAIRCKFAVTDDDREVEIIMKQHEIAKYIRTQYGAPADFGGMSCEMIAREIAERFGCHACEVLEDGLGGAEYVKGKE